MNKINLWYELKILFLAGLVWGIICLILALVAPAKENYPDRSINLIVTINAGSAKDIVDRALVSKSKEPIIILNKPGAGGSIALSLLSTSRPDGYTLASCGDSSIILNSILQKTPYDPMSFTYIMGYAIGGRGAFLVRDDSPWKTFKDFIEYARENPGKVTYSSTGFGMPQHIIMEMIAKKEGIDIVHVPCSGSSRARTALTSKSVDICSNGADWTNYSGKGTGIRALATNSDIRSPYAPNVPTVKELGYEPFLESWNIMGPAGMQLDVVRKIESTFVKLAKDPDFREKAERVNVTVNIVRHDDLNSHLKFWWGERAKLRDVLALFKDAK